MSLKLGIIARCDNTGLGNQTKELVDMLKPERVMVINSQSFSKNKQYPNWYRGYDCHHVRGFPRLQEIESFVKGLDVVLSCETFYNKDFISIARRRGVKTVLQYNYEFLDNLQRPELDLPDVLLSPSYWALEAITEAFGDKAKVLYLPPPTNPDLFAEVRSKNVNKDYNKMLHIGGKAAHLDRNGTRSIIEMLEHSTADYKMVIRTQSKLDINTKDPRLSIEFDNIENRQDMYSEFDGMILPRRYAGLCLPMNEALMSGLPVFMTDISPNNKVLPKEWLASATKNSEFKARTMIDVYEVDPKELAKVVDDYVNNKNKMDLKLKAFEIAHANYSVDNLYNKYIDVLTK